MIELSSLRGASAVDVKLCDLNGQLTNHLNKIEFFKLGVFFIELPQIAKEHYLIILRLISLDLEE